MNATSMLERLTAVKQTAPGRWIAQCPAHEDKTPSLSIRETQDGRVLLHCFGGCETQLILQALAFDFGDLFDKPLAHHRPPIRGGFSARELLELLCHEVTVATLLAEQALHAPLTEGEHVRLIQAAGRLIKARSLLHA